MALIKLSETSLDPRCIIEAQPHNPPFAIEFHDHNGHIFGFPYGHLLHYVCHPDPDPKPNDPPDLFALQFSTYKVVLHGWRLSNLLPLLSQGRLAAVHALKDRYEGLSSHRPFVSKIYCTDRS